MVDGKGAEARATVEVVGSAVDGGPFPPPWDGGSGEAGGGGDAGTDAGRPDAAREAATSDGASPGDGSAAGFPPAELGDKSPDRQGCTCGTAGARAGNPAGAGLAGVLALLLGVRRRRGQVRTRPRSQTTSGVTTFGQ